MCDNNHREDLVQGSRTIIAVARKLAIALWRYLERGLVPQGAVLASR